jgi:cell filamentation protein
VAERAGHPLDVRRINRQAYIEAMIAAFHGDEAPLVTLLGGLID